MLWRVYLLYRLVHLSKNVIVIPAFMLQNIYKFKLNDIEFN